MKIMWVALLMLIAPPALAAPLQVVASFSVLGDMVREVAGDAAECHVLIGPESDPHSFEPTPQTARLVAGADLVVLNGLGFEGWMTRLLPSTHAPRQVMASAAVTPLLYAGDRARPDPHAWHDVENAMRYVLAIRDGLVAADPAHTKSYQANAARYLLKLQALSDWVKAQWRIVPQSERRIVTSHDALRYYGAAYGIDIIAPLGAGTEGAPSAAVLAHLIDAMRARHIRAIFLENNTDPRLMQQLANDAGARIKGTLYFDALSSPGGDAATYIAFIRHNTEILVRGLTAK